MGALQGWHVGVGHLTGRSTGATGLRTMSARRVGWGKWGGKNIHSLENRLPGEEEGCGPCGGLCPRVSSPHCCQVSVLSHIIPFATWTNLQ